MLLDYIFEYHNVVSGAKVKYIEPIIDTRSGLCFAIKFRGFGWNDHIVTDFYDNEEISLYEKCINFLNSKKEN